MRRSKTLSFSGVILVLLFFCGSAHSLDVCGTVSGTWTTSQSPYVVTCSVTVNSGVTLTIEAGVTVKFASATQLTVNGTLIAIGTAANPITFTSNAATPTPGSWRSIYFASPADVINSRLSYANISYGGATDPGSVTMNGPYTGSWITIDHLTVSNSSSSGIYIGNANYVTVDSSTISNCSGAGVTINTGGQVTNSTITGNGTYGINYTGYAWGPLSNNTISNNGNYAIGADSATRIDSLASLTLTGNGGGTKNAVGLRPGNTIAAAVWHSGAPWEILGTVTIPSTATLTIDPGVTAKFASGTQLLVNAKLIAIGTAGSPIT
ncbi:right-handed parallel beta-helix repeat-containing protein, partial [bacterium]|nr:right-handed parallel beta-helix repeat-containing protein [bacterium]